MKENGGGSGGGDGEGEEGVSHLGGWEMGVGRETILTGLGTGTNAWCPPSEMESGDKSRHWQLPEINWGKRRQGQGDA